MIKELINAPMVFPGKSRLSLKDMDKELTAMGIPEATEVRYGTDDVSDDDIDALFYLLRAFRKHKQKRTHTIEISYDSDLRGRAS